MFPGQHPNEKVIFKIERQAAVLFRPALYITLLTFGPILAFIFFKFSVIFSYVFFAWLILASVYFFRTWYCFKHSKYILTTTRLISVDQRGIFYQNISETPLEKIQDVSLEIKGFWSSIWNFGTIYVQTAGTAERFALHFVEEPRKIKDQIVEALHSAGNKEGREDKGDRESGANKRVFDIRKSGRHEKDFWD